jgi:hypothetical protein
MVVAAMIRESLKNAVLVANTELLTSTESFAVISELPQAENGLTAILEGEIRLFKRAL